MPARSVIPDHQLATFHLLFATLELMQLLDKGIPDMPVEGIAATSCQSDSLICL